MGSFTYHFKKAINLVTFPLKTNHVQFTYYTLCCINLRRYGEKEKDQRKKS